MYAKVAGGVLAYIAGLAILTMACLYDLNAGVSPYSGAQHAEQVTMNAYR